MTIDDDTIDDGDDDCPARTHSRRNDSVARPGSTPPDSTRCNVDGLDNTNCDIGVSDVELNPAFNVLSFTDQVHRTGIVCKPTSARSFSLEYTSSFRETPAIASPPATVPPNKDSAIAEELQPRPTSVLTTAITALDAVRVPTASRTRNVIMDLVPMDRWPAIILSLLLDVSIFVTLDWIISKAHDAFNDGDSSEQDHAKINPTDALGDTAGPLTGAESSS